jgi:chorismate synthase
MNTFGTRYRVSVFGESHGKCVGVLIDGCPAGQALSEDDFTADLQRRRSGAKGTTTRIEADLPEIKSGVFNGKTTGAPIMIEFQNKNTQSKDYSNLIKHPRPSHADFVAQEKYKGLQDYRGGGHFSGRMTLALVAAGVVAKKLISDISISAELTEVAGQKDIQQAITTAIGNRDSVGGIIECKATKMPVGLGEPFFNSVESQIAHLAFSVPGIKGIEFGKGFEATRMTGQAFNDPIIDKKGTTKSNHSGGINGGISNGNNLVFRVAVRPTASIFAPQETYNFESQSVETLEIKGRHDVCIALRVPVIIEAITAIALANLSL